MKFGELLPPEVSDNITLISTFRKQIVLISFYASQVSLALLSNYIDARGGRRTIGGDTYAEVAETGTDALIIGGTTC